MSRRAKTPEDSAKYDAELDRIAAVLEIGDVFQFKKRRAKEDLIIRASTLVVDTADEAAYGRKRYAGDARGGKEKGKALEGRNQRFRQIADEVRQERPNIAKSNLRVAQAVLDRVKAMLGRVKDDPDEEALLESMRLKPDTIARIIR